MHVHLLTCMAIPQSRIAHMLRPTPAATDTLITSALTYTASQVQCHRHRVDPAGDPNIHIETMFYRVI